MSSAPIIILLLIALALTQWLPLLQEQTETEQKTELIEPD
jgi:hypothetical protein